MPVRTTPSILAIPPSYPSDVKRRAFRASLSLSGRIAIVTVFAAVPWVALYVRGDVNVHPGSADATAVFRLLVLPILVVTVLYGLTVNYRIVAAHAVLNEAAALVGTVYSLQQSLHSLKEIVSGTPHSNDQTGGGLLALYDTALLSEKMLKSEALVLVEEATELEMRAG